MIINTVGLGPAIVLSVLCLHLLVCPFIFPFLLSFGLFLFFFRIPFEVVYWRLAFHEVSSWPLWVLSPPASGCTLLLRVPPGHAGTAQVSEQHVLSLRLHWGLQPAGYGGYKL